MPHSTKPPSPSLELHEDNILKLLRLKRKNKYERAIEYAVRVLQYNGFDVHVRNVEQGSIPLTTIFACPSVLLDFHPDSLPSIPPSSPKPPRHPPTNSTNPTSNQNIVSSSSVPPSNSSSSSSPSQ